MTSRNGRFHTLTVMAGLAVIGIAALPGSAHAWWRGGVAVGIVAPPVVVAPPVYAAPPPVVYAPPPPVVYAPPPAPPPGYRQATRAWIPSHWDGPRWVPGHWA
jgi:hypothetical protein